MGKTMKLNRLLRNELDDGSHWLHVDLAGAAPNYFGVGARVELMDGSRRQSRQTGSDEGRLSQNSLTVEFGLGDASWADTLRVWWPSGAVQESLLVAADQRILMVEPLGTGAGDATPPGTLALLAPHPNPFNPRTCITFELGESSPVRLELFDVGGRKVATLLDEERLEFGRHSLTWNGRDGDGRPLPSGVYLLTLRSGEGSLLSRKLVLLN